MVIGDMIQFEQKRIKDQRKELEKERKEIEKQQKEIEEQTFLDLQIEEHESKNN